MKLNLTTREKEILALIAKGFTTKEIAVKLENSPKTVEAFRASMMRKNNVKNMFELACSHCMNNLKPAINLDDYTDRYTEIQIIDAMALAFKATECEDGDLYKGEKGGMMVGLCGKKTDIISFMIEFHKRLP